MVEDKLGVPQSIQNDNLPIVINQSAEAYTLIQQIAGMMRCYPIWSGGKLTLVQDRPINPDDADACTYQIPTYTFSLANTLNGFSYSGVSLKTRHGKIVVEYFNMNTIDSEILDLKKELLKMFFLVESQWEKGATAILNYDQDSEDLFKWYQQLVAESLGKNNKGLLPIISSVPKDNHSLMQYNLV